MKRGNVRHRLLQDQRGVCQKCGLDTQCLRARLEMWKQRSEPVSRRGLGVRTPKSAKRFFGQRQIGPKFASSTHSLTSHLLGKKCFAGRRADLVHSQTWHCRRVGLSRIHHRRDLSCSHCLCRSSPTARSYMIRRARTRKSMRSPHAVSPCSA